MSKGFPKGHKLNVGKNNPMYGVRTFGKDNPNWKGGKIILEGYIYIYKPDHPFANNRGYVPEHRLVMEKHLGRVLSPAEKVHHKNHERADNRLENLMLCPNDSYHKKHFHKAKRDTQGKFKKVAGL